MALTPGSRLGVFEIAAQIGEGGMGQVYRATDTKLKRQVAIKVLPPSLAADRDRLARFQREAEVLASLNHPNIAAIYGLEESPSTNSGQAGIIALVMELVEGDDLSQRIARGPIPIDEALPIAKQIAEALEAAHEQGIIHRDLKPANIKVRSDGRAKVLDFGLAKALDTWAGGAGRADLSNSPTITSPAGMTGVGIILGTAAYMSPEQARGKTVDKRADIWAFGCVLYEMLTAKQLFAGESVAETLGLIFSREPDLETLPAATPVAVRRLLTRCLKKDPRARLRDIGEARVQLEEVISGVPDDRGGAPPIATAAPSSRQSPRLAWFIAAAAALAAVAFAVPAARYLRETLPPETRLDIVTPATDQPTSFALSPGGRQIVFVASGDSTSRLWRR